MQQVAMKSGKILKQESLQRFQTIPVTCLRVRYEQF